MNKVILLSDQEMLPKGLMSFAAMLNEQAQILLTGVFLPKDDYWDALLYYPPTLPYLAGDLMDNVIKEYVAIDHFKKTCTMNNIDYRIHEASFVDLKPDLKKESRFADLILLSQESLQLTYSELVHHEYTKDLMHYTECPVMIIPEQACKVEHLILTYDGSASSVYAIRQFAALFPEFTKLETTLIYVNADNNEDIPDRAYLEELAARHFLNLTIQRLDIDPKKYFTTWLQDRPNSLLVAGAKGRGALSEFFRKSFLFDTLSDFKLPVFIAHQ